MAGSGHFPQALPNFHARRSPLTIRTDLVKEKQFILEASYLYRPLGMAVGVADGIEAGDDSKPQEHDQQLPCHFLAGSAEVDPDIARLRDCNRTISGPQMPQEQSWLLLR